MEWFVRTSETLLLVEAQIDEMQIRLRNKSVD
jgi:hypothetical protein